MRNEEAKSLRRFGARKEKVLLRRYMYLAFQHCPVYVYYSPNAMAKCFLKRANSDLSTGILFAYYGLTNTIMTKMVAFV